MGQVTANPRGPIGKVNRLVLISAKQLAAMLGISPRTVWRMRSAGHLPRAVKPGGGTTVRWKLADLRLWLEWDCCCEAEFDERKKKGVGNDF